MMKGMKIKVETTYILTEADARRLKNLARTLSVAVAELLDARCQESMKYAAFANEEDYEDEWNFDLNEMMTHEQAYELRQSISGAEAD